MKVCSHIHPHGAAVASCHYRHLLLLRLQRLQRSSALLRLHAATRRTALLLLAVGLGGRQPAELSAKQPAGSDPSLPSGEEERRGEEWRGRGGRSLS